MTIPPPTERQARWIWLAVTGLSVAMLVALAAALIWGLGKVLQLLAPVLWPIAVAGVLAYLLDPLVDYIQHRHRWFTRPRAIISVFILALMILGTIFGSIVPQLVNETTQLATQVPAYATRVSNKVEYWINHPPELVRRFLERTNPLTNPPPVEVQGAIDTNAPAPPSINAPATGTTNTIKASPPTQTIGQDTLQNATEWAARTLPKVGSWLFGQVGRVASWFGVLAGLALIPVYTFYFLLEKQGISSHWTNYLPVTDSKFKNELVFVLSSINNYLITFFRGQVLVAVCDGVLYGTGFLIVGLPYAVLIGVMAMFLTMVPFLGAIVTCFTALVIAIVQFGDWVHPALVLAVFGCVQALEGLVISPKIMGGRVGLHPVTIIIAVMAGTTLLGGILGGILAIPLTAALRVIMFRYIWKRGENPQPAGA